MNLHIQRWRPALALIALVLAMSVVVGFQSNIGPVTNSQVALNAVTTAQRSVLFQNYGFASHWLNFCINGGTASAVQIDLEGSNDGTNWFAISSVATITSGCGVLEAGGYYNNISANLIQYTANGTTLSATYSGASYAVATGGVMQIFKTPQPVTYPPAGRASCYADSGASISTNCATFKDFSTNATLGTGIVLYGMSVVNSAASVCNVSVYDDTLNTPNTWSNRPVPANSAVDFIVPTIGIQYVGHLVAFSNVAQGNNTCVVTAFYKGTVNVPTKANSGGGVTSSTRPYP